MENLFNPEKKVTLNLVGIDGNAFSIMGAFRKQARREGWTNEEIELVIDKCMSGNYDHLLQTIIVHSKPDYEDEDEYAEADTIWHKPLKDEEGKCIGYRTYQADCLISETIYK